MKKKARTISLDWKNKEFLLVYGDNTFGFILGIYYLHKVFTIYQTHRRVNPISELGIPYKLQLSKRK